MNSRSTNRDKKRKLPGKGMMFGKMWLVTPHIGRFRAGMDITNHSVADMEGNNDGD